MKTIEQEMVLLQKWFNLNRLSLNLSKTKFMLFTNQKASEDVHLTLNGNRIEEYLNLGF